MQNLVTFCARISQENQFCFFVFFVEIRKAQSTLDVSTQIYGQMLLVCIVGTHIHSKFHLLALGYVTRLVWTRAKSHCCRISIQLRSRSVLKLVFVQGVCV